MASSTSTPSRIRGARRTLGLAGQHHAVVARGGGALAQPVDEGQRLLREAGLGAERLRIDHDRQHPVVDRAAPVGLAVPGAAAAQRTAQQFAGHSKPVALVLAEGHQCAHAAVGIGHDHHAGFGRGPAFAVDQGAGRNLLALVVRHAHLALCDPAGGEVEHKGFAHRVAHADRDADAAGIRAEPPVTALPGGHDGSRQHVDEVQRHESARDGHLGEVSDSAEVMGVGQRSDAGAVALDPFEHQFHRLLADGLAVALLTIQAEQHAAVEPDRDLCVGLEVLLEHGVDIARRHADAVRIVAAEVGQHQVGGDQSGFCVRAAGRADQLGDLVLEIGGSE